MQFCYWIESHRTRTWHESKKTCDENLANLVSIGSQEEYDFLEEVLHKKPVSSCLHIGLQTYNSSSIPSWVDGNLWDFSKLNISLEQENKTHMCVYRDVDGLWYLTKCSTICGFICKKYRGRCLRDVILAVFLRSSCNKRKRKSKLYLISVNFSRKPRQNSLCSLVTRTARSSSLFLSFSINLLASFYERRALIGSVLSRAE